METNIWLEAVRKKLRFETPQGSMTLEDLWDLPLTATGNKVSIDTIATAIANAEEKVISVVQARKTNPDATLRRQIINEIIGIKQAEINEKNNASAKQAEIQQLKEILEQKQAEELKGLDKAEIERRLAALQS